MHVLLRLVSGVDLVTLLWRTCVESHILKTLELLVAFFAPCPHLHHDTHYCSYLINLVGWSAIASHDIM